MSVRLATYNVENLFGRAKVLNFANHATGDDKMRRIADLQAILEQPTYSLSDRRRAGDLYQELYDVVGYRLLRSAPGVGYYLFRREDRDGDDDKESYILAPGGADEWQGFLTYDRDQFSDTTSRMTARVIREIGADIVCINEVEDRHVLDAFNSDRLDRAYPFNMLIDCRTDPRRIDVGLYSKFPIGGLRSNIFTETADGKALFSRDCLEVEILLPDGPLFLLLNHFKSKFGGGGDDRREAQAREVRRILETRYDLATQRVAVLGDLNDTPGSVPLAPLLGMAGLTDVLTTPAGPTADARWTYVYEADVEQIDYILVSTPLLAALTGAGVERRGMPPDSLAAAGAAEAAFDEITSWRNAGSDHAAVFADFSIG